MRSILKINKDIVIFGGTFFLALISIMKIPILPKIILQCLKLAAISFFLIYIIKNQKKTRLFDQFDIVVFGIIVIISSYLNYHFTSYFFFGVVYAIMLLGFFLILSIAVDNHGVIPVVKLMFICFFVICIINDLCLGICIDSNYLIGTKFSVAYWHCMMILTYSLAWQLQGGVNRLFLVLITFWGFCIAYLTECSTGLVEIAILFIMLFFGKKLRRILANPILMLVTMLIIGYSIYLWDMVLSLQYVREFVINVLHENLTLTGRIQIYEMLPKLAQEKPIIGWGYGTEIVRERLYGNAQNGLWHIGIQYGIVGVVLFMLITFRTFRANKSDEFENKFPIAVIVYTFILISCVEINYGYIFFISLALYRAISSTERRNRKGLKRYGKLIRKSSKKGIRVIA